MPIPMDQNQAAGATLKGTAVGSSRPRGWFHVGLSGVLLLCVVVGFSPTFFLRRAFTDRPLPL